MNPNFKVQSIDGFGDREDIALARSKAEEQIKENQANEEAKKHNSILKASMFGTDNNAENISDVVQKMIEGECYGKLILKSRIAWDVETLSDAVNLACIKLGLSDEDFSPSYHDNGNEIDIRLF